MMVRRGAGVVAAALLLVMNAAAQFQSTPQNARVNALGGTFIMNDMNDVLRYAAFMGQYKNSAQGTWLGPITGIKAIGDVVSLGVIFNRGLLLDRESVNSFYTTGSGTLSVIPNTPVLATQNVPHFLFGLNLSVVSLGFDLFYEYASATFHNEIGTTPAQTEDDKVRIKNPGGIASLIFGTDAFSIAGKVGLSFPRIAGKREYDDGTTTTKTEVTSDKGIALEFGGEAEVLLSAVRVNAGADLIFESYTYAVDTTVGRDVGNNRLAFYGGFEGDLFTAAKWGIMYNLNLINRDDSGTPADTTKSRTVVNSISCGIENTWTSVWIFDECYARGGLSFAITTPVRYVKGAATDSRMRGQSIFAPVLPTIGAGVKKSVFKLEITIDPTAWAGLVSGPKVGTVTATLMF